MDTLNQYLDEANLTLEDFLYSLDFLVAVFLLILAIVTLVIVRIIIKRHVPKKTLESNEYEREIPAGWSPAEICPLFYNFKRTVYVDESISSTILDLTRRGFIEVEPDERRKNADLRITSKAHEDIVEFENESGENVQRKIPLLQPHELKLLDLLDDVVPRGEWFSMKAFEEYCKRNQQATAAKIEEYRKLTETKSERMGLFVAKGKNGNKNIFTAIGSLILLAGLILMVYGPEWLLFTSIALLIGGAMLVFGSNEPRRLTKEGAKWYLYFHAMEDFFNDFTMLDERELPDLVVWEEYMVYATAMGAAEKVAKNLQIAYPQLKEQRTGGIKTDYDPFLAYIIFKTSGHIVRSTTRMLINTAGKFATRFSASGLTRVFGNGGANIGKTIGVLGKIIGGRRR